jgi:hypothetical protein
MVTYRWGSKPANDPPPSDRMAAVHSWKWRIQM